MRTFKDLYIVVCYSLLTVQLGFISIWLYNKYIYHRVMYYGGEKKIEEVSLNYFYILRALLYSTFVLVVLWALLTPLAILSNKRTVVKEERVGMSKGLIGFVIAVIFLIKDPFGILKWFSK